jgi:hypothetical protein
MLLSGYSLILFRCLLYGVNDFDVPGAAAEIARDCFFDHVARRLRIHIEQSAGGYQHPRSADAALRAAAFEKRLLQRLKLAVTRKTFDSDYSRLRYLTNRNETGVDDLSVNYHRAGSALAFAAPFFRARQPQIFAKHI